MAKLVAFDTNICVWGVLKMSDRDNLVSRTRALIKTLQESGYDIMLPAPALGELLAAVPIEQQAEISDRVSRELRIYPFDILAAESYAEMVYTYNHSHSAHYLKEYAKAGQVPRQKVKVDYMIAAIARAVQADCIYTEDEGLRKFASPFIEVRSVPNRLLPEPKPVFVQQGLFDFLDVPTSRVNK